MHDAKREVRVYDYADVDVPMLARMFDRRCRGYEAIGYTVLLPASAIPGWPTDVTLPADPIWKRDFSGSVRRQIRKSFTKKSFLKCVRLRKAKMIHHLRGFKNSRLAVRTFKGVDKLA